MRGLPTSVLRLLWRASVRSVVALGVAPLWISRRWRGGSRRGVRSLWAGRPILTLPVNAKAERLLGVRVATLVYETYFITEAFDYNLSRWSRTRVVRKILPYLVFIWACWKFNRFHFFCDAGLLPPHPGGQFNPLELAWYRRLGKQVFFWTYGADVRTRDATRALGEPNCCTECPAPGRACICEEPRGRANLARIAASAAGLFAIGDMTEYTPGSRNDLYFWPVDLEAGGGRKYAPKYPPAQSDRPLSIVHAPNHRHFKGTRFLLQSVERLRSEGHSIELTLVEGVPNDRALEMYQSADIVFDQCLIGFHGYVAIEAMAMGKPVMCYIRKPQAYLLAPEECPIVNTPSDRIDAVLRSLIQDRRRLHDLGVQGRKYVEKYFALPAFARRLHRAYQDLGA